jgi:hypothetical protein
MTLSFPAAILSSPKSSQRDRHHAAPTRPPKAGKPLVDLGQTAGAGCPENTPYMPVSSADTLNIHTIRETKVILDSDLARLYGVLTKRLNEATRRNADRFPVDFCFQLTRTEVADLKSQFATSSGSHGGRRKLPWAFTEHGALMAANVLNSPRAVQMSIFIVRAFLRMRQEFVTSAAILKRLVGIDRKLLVHDVVLRDLYRKLQPLLSPSSSPPKREIGFHVKP